MTSKTTGRKASTKTPHSPASTKTKAPRTAARKNPATTASAAARTPSRKRRPAKASAPIAPLAPIDSMDTKQARLIALLRAQPGATIEQMTTLTGWQAHTVRGTISGVLRKRLGLDVTSLRGDAGSRVYRIVGSAPSA